MDVIIIADSRQTLARVVAQAYSLEQQNAGPGGLTLGFAMHLVNFFPIISLELMKLGTSNLVC